MVSSRREIRPDPTVVHLDDLLDSVAEGRLRVPEFQRPFEWRPEQMLDLFESIESGYPIGSLLLWQTDQPIASTDTIGGIALPDPPESGEVSYVLDGHQRLSTLYGTLRRTAAPTTGIDPREWRWSIHRDLTAANQSEWYRHHRPSSLMDREPPDHYLPLRQVTRTLDFLRFSRHLELKVRDHERLARLIEEADAVAQRIKSYKITLIRLRGAGLDEAVEVYTRLNRKGLRMDADQMVSALTYRKGSSTLANRIDEIVTSVADTGFGEVPRMAVFRTVLAVSGEADVMSPRWEAVARELQNKEHYAVPAAERAIRKAVDFLRHEVRLPLARLLPYAHQLTLLAAFFHHRPEPTQAQRETLRRWFWVTSWASTFAGANSTTIRGALREMELFAAGTRSLTIDVTGVLPMPDVFNFNSARTRAYVAWELMALPERLNVLGHPIDLINVLASAGSQAYRPVAALDKRPANRLVLPTVAGMSPAEALRHLSNDETTARILASHGIPEKAWHRLNEGKGTVFVDDRTALLAARLRAFAEEVGVRLGPDLEGVADYDTE
jgi:hypothetical protein